MIIKSAKKNNLSKRDLIRERDAKLVDYNAKLDAYNQQVRAYDNDYKLNIDSAVSKIKKYLSPEIDAFDHPVEVSVKDYTTTGYTTDTRYYVKLSYVSRKPTTWHSSSGVPASGGGHTMGISFTYIISTREHVVRNDDGSVCRTEDGGIVHEISVDKSPQIVADFLESDDYATLLAMHNLFTKIDTVDWVEFLEGVLSNAPEKNKYVTLDMPIEPSEINELNDAIDYSTIERTAGSGAWVKVAVRREQSYVSWSSHSKYPGVQGIGWVRIISATGAYFTFNFLKIYKDYHREYWNPSDIEKAMSRECRLKKSYFTLIKPIEMMTTEELKEYNESDNT